MTVDDVRVRVAAIREVVDDDEVAHAREDRLHQEVLRAIAAGAENAAELAREALVTMTIAFARWCA